MTRIIILISALFALSACAPPPAIQDSSEIAALSAGWEVAFNGSDVDGLVALYAEDARMFSPNQPTVTGKKAIRAALDELMAGGFTLDLTSTEARASGDLGHNVGSFVMRGADGSVIDTGKFIETWQRRDGKWQITNDIWNSDAATAPSGGAMAHVMFMHEVEDPDRWMAAWRGKDSRHKLFKAHGSAHVHAFHSPDQPGLTGLVVAVNDMDALQAMLASEEGAAAAAADGVKMDTLVMLTEVK